MQGKTQPHEAKDMILRFLIEKTAALNPNQHLRSAYVAAELFPHEPKELIYLLMNDMMDTVHPLFESHVNSREIPRFDVLFRANAITRAFLDGGGFTREHQDAEEARAKEERNAQIDDEIRRDNLKLNAWNKRFLIINAVLAIANLVWTIYWSIKTSK